MEVLKRRHAVANSSNPVNEVISSEYWLNLVVIFDKEGKRYTQQIPGCGFPIDSILKNTLDEVPNENASLASIVNQMKAELPDFVKDIHDAMLSLDKGKRGILFYCDTVNGDGDLVLTKFALELYHKDPDAKKMKLEGNYQKQDRVKLSINSLNEETQAA